MTSVFLTHKELVQLTGYRQRLRQCAWLSRHGWAHATNATGDPVVRRAEMEKRLVSSLEDEQQSTTRPLRR